MPPPPRQEPSGACPRARARAVTIAALHVHRRRSRAAKVRLARPWLLSAGTADLEPAPSACLLARPRYEEDTRAWCRLKAAELFLSHPREKDIVTKPVRSAEHGAQRTIHRLELLTAHRRMVAPWAGALRCGKRSQSLGRRLEVHLPDFHVGDPGKPSRLR